MTNNKLQLEDREVVDILEDFNDITVDVSVLQPQVKSIWVQKIVEPLNSTNARQIINITSSLKSKIIDYRKI